MNSTTQKNTMDGLFADNEAGNISAADLRSVVTEIIKTNGGHVFYPNAVATKQSIPADVWTELTLDNSSPEKSDLYKPYYQTQDIITGTGKYDILEIPLGTVINNRFQFEMDTSVNNTEVKFRGRVYDSGDNLLFSFIFNNLGFKTAGSHTIAPHLMIFYKCY